MSNEDFLYFLILINLDFGKLIGAGAVLLTSGPKLVIFIDHHTAKLVSVNTFRSQVFGIHNELRLFRLFIESSPAEFVLAHTHGHLPLDRVEHIEVSAIEIKIWG